MFDDHDDEALHRLRAADPARGAHPDQASLRRRLMDRTPLGHRAAGLTGGSSAGADPDRAVRVQDGTTRGSRSTLVAAAAAAALAIAAGGYAVGAQTADDAPGGTGVAATGTDDDRSGTPDHAAGEDSASGMAEPGIQDEYADDQGSAESATGSYYPYGPTVLSAGPELSTEGGTGEVKVLRAADVDPVEFLSSWAAELGVEGDVEEMEGDDYADLTSGAIYLSLSSTDFSYSNMLTDPYCEEMYGESTLDIFFGGSAPFSGEDCLPAGDLPSDEEAIAQAQEFMATTGIPLDDVEWSVYRYEDDPQMNVSGRRPDRPANTIEVTLSGAGVSGAYGSLGEYESLGEYPLLSPAEAVERASDPRFTWAGVWIPELDDEALMLEETDPAQAPERFELTAGSPIPYPVNEATIVDATLKTGILSLDDGTEVAVPAYDLVDEDGLHHAVLALSEEALDFTP